MGRRDEFEQRLAKHYDDLKWTYHYVYDQFGASDEDFESLMRVIEKKYQERQAELKALDQRDSHWFMAQDMIGMMLYVDLFAVHQPSKQRFSTIGISSSGTRPVSASGPSGASRTCA